MSEVVDGVAYDVPLVEAQRFRYMVSSRRVGDPVYIASNSLRKVKEAMRARWMSAGWISRNDGQEFAVSCGRGGRQELSDSLPYAPRYGVRATRRRH